jgi:hypothetical protein
MKRLALLLAVTAFAIVVPAQAKRLAHPSPPAHPANPRPRSNGNTGTGNGHSCTAQNEGYNASGTLTSATLTRR